MMNGIGFSDVLTFIGVIEGERDKDTGMARVRAFGIHPPVSEGTLMTEDLPWAIVLNGTFGEIHALPREGDFVMGMFLDGREAQQPVLLGTMPQFKNTLPTGSETPVDDGYVKASYTNVNTYGESPTPPQISGRGLHNTPLAVQESLRREGITSSTGNGWDEDAPISGGRPDRISVWKSKHGNSFVMIDGTEDQEKITITHASGSHIQIDDSGKIKVRSMGDRQSVTEGADQEFVGGNQDVIIEGNYNINVTQGNSKIYVAGDLDLECQNFNLTSRGKATFNIAEGLDIRSAKIAAHANTDNIDIRAEGEMRLSSGSKISTVSESFQMDGGDNINISAGNIELDGSSETEVANTHANFRVFSFDGDKASPSEVVVPNMPAPPPAKVFPDDPFVRSVPNSGGGYTDSDDGDEDNTASDTFEDIPPILQTAEASEAKKKYEEFLGRPMSDTEFAQLVSATNAEAGSDPRERAYISGVILNRARKRNQSVTDVLYARGQFEAVTGGRNTIFSDGPSDTRASQIYGATVTYIDDVPKDLYYFDANNPNAYTRRSRFDEVERERRLSGGRLEVVGASRFWPGARF